MTCRGNFGLGDQNFRNKGPPGSFFFFWSVRDYIKYLFESSSFNFNNNLNNVRQSTTCSFATLGCIEAMKQTST